MVVLNEAEWVDDLQYKGLKIVLSRCLPRFTTDAVLLSAFVSAKPTDNVVDIGSGTGVISLLVNARTAAAVTAIEIQRPLHELLCKSVELNSLEDCVFPLNLDCREAYKTLNGKFSVAVCNPPYFDTAASIPSDDAPREHTRAANTAESMGIFVAASQLLRSGGRFFVCYPAKRITDLFCMLRAAKLEPKRLQLVRSKQTKPPYLALLECAKDGGNEIRVESDLVLLTDDGEYTKEANAIYHR